MQIPDIDFEKSLLPPNCRFLLGIDEVGRGPLAGPVAIGAFLLDLSHFDLDFFLENKVRDSKTMSQKQRLHALSQFDQSNHCYKVFFAHSSVIDRIGIQPAIISIIKKALFEFHGQYDFVLLDGNLDPFSHSSERQSRDVGAIRSIPHLSLASADTKCFSVAAASIVAKVARDQLMVDFDKKYPGYNFSAHKGYGTSAHFTALRRLGPCPIHRQSYKPIRKLSSFNHSS